MFGETGSWKWGGVSLLLWGSLGMKMLCRLCNECLKIYIYIYICVLCFVFSWVLPCRLVWHIVWVWKTGEECLQRQMLETWGCLSASSGLLGLKILCRLCSSFFLFLPHVYLFLSSNRRGLLIFFLFFCWQGEGNEYILYTKTEYRVHFLHAFCAFQAYLAAESCTA